MKLEYRTQITCYVYLHKDKEGMVNISVTTDPTEISAVEGFISYKETTIDYPGVLNAPRDDNFADGGSVTSDSGADEGDSTGEA